MIIVVILHLSGVSLRPLSDVVSAFIKTTNVAFSRCLWTEIYRDLMQARESKTKVAYLSKHHRAASYQLHL